MTSTAMAAIVNYFTLGIIAFIRAIYRLKRYDYDKIMRYELIKLHAEIQNIKFK